MSIFLSYDARDSSFVDQMAEAFRELRIQCVSINLKVELNQGIFDPKRLSQRLASCDQGIVVLSKSYTSSDWLVGESLAFLLKEKVTNTEFMVPVLIEDCEVPAHLKNRAITDFRNRPFQEAFEELLARLTRKRQVFVSMMFGDKMLDSAYENSIRPIIRHFKYEPVRIDQIPDGGKIADRILDSILGSEIVVADLTGERPNCYYEIGYAHALSKKMILAARKGTRIHFDLSGYQFVFWETEGELKRGLKWFFDEFRRNRLSSPT